MAWHAELVGRLAWSVECTNGSCGLRYDGNRSWLGVVRELSEQEVRIMALRQAAVYLNDTAEAHKKLVYVFLYRRNKVLKHLEKVEQNK